MLGSLHATENLLSLSHLRTVVLLWSVSVVFINKSFYKKYPIIYFLYRYEKKEATAIWYICKWLAFAIVVVFCWFLFLFNTLWCALVCFLISFFLIDDYINVCFVLEQWYSEKKNKVEGYIVLSTYASLSSKLFQYERKRILVLNCLLLYTGK